ncbi:MAG: glycosyltransferase [Bacteroidetes bacterium]|jgi:glycosyltransferase involved in cell wall biosynthesis|nr:glycosyltransferase [Bacteroidota bacterium]
MPVLSVITINYNDAAGLEKTMASILGQSFRDFEYIVIDGGSKDGSTDVIEKYKDKLSYWISEKDGGIYNAQNKGWKKANGEYCLFLNSGDFLASPDVLEKVFASKPTEDIVYGNMYINWGPNTTLGEMPDTITFEQMLLDTIWHPVSFIKREVLNACGGYNENYKMVADYAFFFKAVVVKNVSTRHTPVPIAVFNTEGLSSKPEKKQQELLERQDVLRENLPEKVAEYLIRTAAQAPSEKSLFRNLLAKFRS